MLKFIKSKKILSVIILSTAILYPLQSYAFADAAAAAIYAWLKGTFVSFLRQQANQEMENVKQTAEQQTYKLESAAMQRLHFKTGIHWGMMSGFLNDNILNSFVQRTASRALWEAQSKVTLHKVLFGFSNDSSKGKSITTAQQLGNINTQVEQIPSQCNPTQNGLSNGDSCSAQDKAITNIVYQGNQPLTDLPSNSPAASTEAGIRYKSEFNTYQTRTSQLAGVINYLQNTKQTDKDLQTQVSAIKADNVNSKESPAAVARDTLITNKLIAQELLVLHQDNEKKISLLSIIAANANNQLREKAMQDYQCASSGKC